MTATLYVAAAIFAVLAVVGLAFIVLDAWANGRVRKAFRDAGVHYEARR